MDTKSKLDLLSPGIHKVGSCNGAEDWAFASDGLSSAQLSSAGVAVWFSGDLDSKAVAACVVDACSLHNRHHPQHLYHCRKVADAGRAARGAGGTSWTLIVSSPIHQLLLMSRALCAGDADAGRAAGGTRAADYHRRVVGPVHYVSCQSRTSNTFMALRAGDADAGRVAGGA